MSDTLRVILLDVFIILLVGTAYYAFLVQPRQREFKRRQKLVTTLTVGMEVLTYGGILGTIRKIDENTGLVHVEVAPGLVLRFIAASITQEFDPKAYAEIAREHMK
jgi:preprotein translocase subunit YajC